MSLETIMVDLRLFHPDGKRVPKGPFLEKLVRYDGDPVVSIRKGQPDQAALVTLVSLETAEFSEEDEPSEAFAEKLGEGLRQAGKWIGKQSPALFKEVRESGCEADVFIGAWIDSDQMDLDFPVEFLRGCAKQKLPISVITNE
jgi:hypothetical protein